MPPLTPFTLLHTRAIQLRAVFLEFGLAPRSRSAFNMPPLPLSIAYTSTVKPSCARVSQVSEFAAVRQPYINWLLYTHAHTFSLTHLLSHCRTHTLCQTHSLSHTVTYAFTHTHSLARTHTPLSKVKCAFYGLADECVSGSINVVTDE